MCVQCNEFEHIQAPQSRSWIDSTPPRFSLCPVFIVVFVCFDVCCVKNSYHATCPLDKFWSRRGLLTTFVCKDKKTPLDDPKSCPECDKLLDYLLITHQWQVKFLLAIIFTSLLKWNFKAAPKLTYG